MKKCIIKNCSNPQKNRCLCSAHYQSSRYLIIQGKTTWQELEKRGAIRKNKAHDQSMNDILEFLKK